MPCAGNVPVIVASSTLTQPSGGSIAATTIFTPSASGLFRLSAYVTSSASLDNPTFTISWTDAQGGQSQISFWRYNTLDTKSLSGSWVFNAASGNDIQIEFDTTTTSAYTVQYVLEQLA